MVYLEDPYPHLLMEMDDAVDVADKTVGDLRDMNQAILMDADVDKGPEVGDVGHNAGKLHAGNKIVDGMHPGIELESLYLGTRVASGLLQLLHDVAERRQADLLGDIALDVDALARLRIIHQIGDRAPVVAGHLLHQLIAFGVDGGSIERVPSTGDAEEAGTLLESHRTKAGHLAQFGSRGEGAVLTPVVHDVLSQLWTESADIGEQMLARRIEIDTDGVDTQLHRLVERMLQGLLVDIVLILADANALGIDLHQLSQRVHETTADADGTTHGDILIGKLLAGCLRRGIDARSVLTHHIGRHAGNLAEDVGRLTRAGAIAHRDGLYAKLPAQVGELLQGGRPGAVFKDRFR